MYKKILVAIDNSDMCEVVLAEAESLAQAMDANLMLLHIQSNLNEQNLNPVFLEPDSFYPSLHTEALQTYMKQWEEIKKQRLDWLRSLCEKLSTQGIKTEFTLNFGDPSRIICEVAKSWGADLIVLGRRGHSGLKELFLGSVSNYVLHHASCSVLTIQPNAIREASSLQLIATNPELTQQEELETVN